MKKHQHKHDSPLPARLASNPAAAVLSYTYAAAVRARNYAYDSLPMLSKKADRPVISVGGIRAGGTGKTPVAMLIGQHIVNNCGYDVAFLSRGYGRPAKKQVIVRPNERADWRLTGDEPCMIHNNIPNSWLGIGANRAAAAKKLSPLLPEKSVLILDDGFQHRQMRRDLDIVCLSEGAFCDRMLPAGYLREPVSSLARADIALIIGFEENINKLQEVKAAVERRFADGAAVAGSTSIRNPKASPICAILLQFPDCWVEARSGEVRRSPPFKTPAVLSGIARPERFLALLRSLSVEPSAVQIFKDHYKFKISDFMPADRRRVPDHHKFKKNGIAPTHDIYLDGMVTTEKDAVRLLSPEFAFLHEIWYLKAGLRFADPEGDGALVLSKINSVMP